MRQEQVGRNDFGFGVASSPAGSEARLEAFLADAGIREALRSISSVGSSTTTTTTQPPSSPSTSLLPGASPSHQSTPQKPHRQTSIGSSPLKPDFPPTPTQTNFPLFRRQSTEGSIKSPAGHASGGRTRTMSSLTLGGLGKGGSTGVGSSSSLGGKAGGGAEKLKKAFGVTGRPSTEKVPESVLTAEEKEIRLEAEFDAKIGKAEAALFSHPTAIANAQIYKSAMVHRYAIIDVPMNAGEPALSLLNVARWKEKTLEAQRRRRTWEQSRLSRTTTDGGDGWRSSESFGSPRAGAGTPLSNGNQRTTSSNGYPPRSSVAGPSMSTSSFEDGSVGANLRSYKFGGEANSSTRRTSRSSNGMHPYQPASLKKEKIFPWSIDAHDVALFDASGGKVDEMLDFGGGGRSTEEFHPLSRVASPLPTVQEVLDGQAKRAEASSSTYGSPKSGKEPLLASPPPRRSLSPLPTHYPRPSSPLSNGQQLHHFPNSGLSPPRPPAVSRSSSFTRKNPTRTPLTSLLTSPSQLQRPHLGEHTVSSPLALTPTLSMTPAVVNLNDRRGSLPDGAPGSPFNSTPRHNHHQSLSSGLPPPRTNTLSLTQSLSGGGRASSPNPTNLSPPSAPSSTRPTHIRRQSDQPRMVLVPKGPYKTRATAKIKRLEDGLDSRSEDEYREEHLSEQDVPGAKSFLSKRSASVEAFHPQHPHHPHMGRLHPHSIKGRVTGMFANSRDVSPQGSDADEPFVSASNVGDRDAFGWRMGGSGRTKGVLRKFARAPFSNSSSSRRLGGDLMEGMMTKGEESEQIEYLEREFGAGEFGEEYSSDTDVAVTFDRRKDWELDRVRSRGEVEREREICREKKQFLLTIRPSVNTFDAALFESKQSFLSLHDQLNSYIQVTYDRFGIQLSHAPLSPQILQFEDLPPLHPLPRPLSTVGEVTETLQPLRLDGPAALNEEDESPTSSFRKTRAHFLASNVRQRRRSSVSSASLQSLANLAEHQAKAKSRSRERNMEEELSMEEITIEELEERLELVRDGWKALGERVRTLAEGRAKAMACYPKLKDSTMDLLAERAEKRQLLEPQSFTPVSIRTPRTEAVLGSISEGLLLVATFALRIAFEFGSRFIRTLCALFWYLVSPLTWPRRVVVWFFEPIVSPLTSGFRRGCHLAGCAVLVLAVGLVCVAFGEE
ncbi:hypothetical protein BDY24DRAFT_93481 [Mrakia frigida]|uniref:uncharacterized protein n=1 Tax=Mrakia frigida TaxID=29902 RepID=UPI003FCC0CBD